MSGWAVPIIKAISLASGYFSVPRVSLLEMFCEVVVLSGCSLFIFLLYPLMSNRASQFQLLFIVL